MPTTVRAARADDLGVLCEFNRRLAEESEGKRLDAAVLAAGVSAILDDPAKGRYYVAMREDQVVGQIMLTTEWSDWRNGWMWWIQSVYVPQGARRRGVFRALFDHVQKMARQERPPVLALRLYVEEHNAVALATYSKLGMAPMGFLVYHKFLVPVPGLQARDSMSGG
jgi:GNAT superfamily N-acetyltransferase